MQVCPLLSVGLQGPGPVALAVALKTQPDPRLGSDTAMVETALPPSMEAWLFDSTNGGAIANLRLERHQPLPPSFTALPRGYTLVRVMFASLNPVDLKIAEIPVLGRFLQRLPATPALDFAGRVVRTTSPALREGQLVAGKVPERAQHGAAAEYTLAANDCCVAIPDGVAPEQASTVGTCGATAYQALVPYAKPGNRVFINGGSGGTGVFQIQVARILGCHVTVSCSGPNIELCRGLGADEALDYTTLNLAEAISHMAQSEEAGLFDLVIDNVGCPWELFKAADHFLKPGGRYIQVGGEVTWPDVKDILWVNLLPHLLGGGKSHWQFLASRTTGREVGQVLEWMAQGRIKIPTNDVIPFEDLPRAYRKLKGGHSRGKIVVEVSGNRGR